jgi:putative membrane protein
LLFVSELEHRVEVIADRGITERVEAGMWQSVVDDLISALRVGQGAAGVLRAIERIGVVLASEFPIRDGDRNELADAPRQF